MQWSQREADGYSDLVAAMLVDLARVGCPPLILVGCLELPGLRRSVAWSAPAGLSRAALAELLRQTADEIERRPAADQHGAVLIDRPRLQLEPPPDRGEAGAHSGPRG